MTRRPTDGRRARSAGSRRPRGGLSCRPASAGSRQDGRPQDQERRRRPAPRALADPPQDTEAPHARGRARRRDRAHHRAARSARSGPRRPKSRAKPRAPHPAQGGRAPRRQGAADSPHLDRCGDRGRLATCQHDPRQTRTVPPPQGRESRRHRAPTRANRRRHYWPSHQWRHSRQGCGRTYGARDRAGTRRGRHRRRRKGERAPSRCSTRS